MPPISVRTDGLERGLWAAFAGLFAVMVAAVYLPTEPVVGVLPLWAVVATAAMLASVVVAAVAGVGYGWPGER